MPEPDRRRMGELGRAFVRANFLRSVQADGLARLLETLAPVMAVPNPG